MIRVAVIIILCLSELMVLPLLVCLCMIARFIRKKIDAGLGPEPLINNVYHKRALESCGYTAETFVNSVYFITNDFDVRADLFFTGIFRIFVPYYLFVRAVFKYKILYFYFTGGSLHTTRCLWKVEPYLYKIAGIKTLVMPYGSDVQEMSRSKNLLFKDVMSKDYQPVRRNRRKVAKRIDLWTSNADYVIGGCEWVDYMYYWDRLMLGHFSIDTNQWKASKAEKQGTDSFKVLHAPNHRNIKGSQYVISAVNELVIEGYNIELVMLEKVSNQQLKQVMYEADVIADQFIIGWYAMFSLEAMSLGKPVLCYLRDDLIDLYTASGLIAENEIPIINTKYNEIKKNLMMLYNNRNAIKDIGKQSREFVERHHSLEAIGKIFDHINKQLIDR